MGRDKLRKFADNETFKNMFQPDLDTSGEEFYLKGKWNELFFMNNHPIVLELGCGKGKYTVGLAERYPDKNFIGVDIKGARMWWGCKTANENQMKNVAFLRTRINFIENFFGSEEVSEIWITFPDPQLKNRKSYKRLTSKYFLSKYKLLLKPDSVIHLKTDNLHLYEFTLEVIKESGHKLLFCTDDLYSSKLNDDVIGIQTHYEKIFMDQGLKIKYLKFILNTVGQ